MMYQADAFVTHAINALAGRSVRLDYLASWFSLLGVPVLVGIVAAQWWRRRDRPHLRHVLLSAGFSFLLGLGLNQVILLFVHRVRPYDAGVSRLIIPPSADWSFPSDHATAVMAIAAAFLLHRMPKAGSAFLAAALLMMFARVYVGIHYAGDVLGGALTGFVAALAVCCLYREGTRLDRLLTGIF